MIKIYYKPNCRYCKTAKEYLASKNIEFEEIDLTKKENREARDYYRSLGVNLLPVIEGDNWILPGWDKEALEVLLTREQNED